MNIFHTPSSARFSIITRKKNKHQRRQDSRAPRSNTLHLTNRSGHVITSHCQISCLVDNTFVNGGIPDIHDGDAVFGIDLGIV